MNARDKYKAIIIGSGQGGNPFAAALTKAKWRTALIEREHVGGTCINEGCTPTKTMVASARVAYLTRRGADYGVHGSQINGHRHGTVRQRKRDIVEKLARGQQRATRRHRGVTSSWARPVSAAQKSDRRAMKDGTKRTLTAEHIFINTGLRPSIRPHRPHDVAYADRPASWSSMPCQTIW